MKEHERFVQLSWLILELKLAYYMPNLVHPDWNKEKSVSDQEYDALETEYRSLAEHLNLPTTACEHVGFPSEHPCGRLVMSKLCSPKSKIKVS